MIRKKVLARRLLNIVQSRKKDAANVLRRIAATFVTVGHNFCRGSLTSSFGNRGAGHVPESKQTSIKFSARPNYEKTKQT